MGVAVPLFFAALLGASPVAFRDGATFTAAGKAVLSAGGTGVGVALNADVACGRTRCVSYLTGALCTNHEQIRGGMRSAALAMGEPRHNGLLYSEVTEVPPHPFTTAIQVEQGVVLRVRLPASVRVEQRGGGVRVAHCPNSWLQSAFAFALSRGQYDSFLKRRMHRYFDNGPRCDLAAVLVVGFVATEAGHALMALRHTDPNDSTDDEMAGETSAAPAGSDEPILLHDAVVRLHASAALSQCVYRRGDYVMMCRFADTASTA